MTEIKDKLHRFVMEWWLPVVSLAIWALVAWFVGRPLVADVFATALQIGRNMLWLLLALYAAIVVGRFIFTGAFARRMTVKNALFLMIFPLDMARSAIWRRWITRQYDEGTPAGASADRAEQEANSKPFYKRAWLWIGMAFLVLSLVAIGWVILTIVQTFALSAWLVFELWFTGTLVWYVIGSCFLDSPAIGVIRALLWFLEACGVPIGRERISQQAAKPAVA